MKNVYIFSYTVFICFLCTLSTAHLGDLIKHTALSSSKLLRTKIHEMSLPELYAYITELIKNNHTEQAAAVIKMGRPLSHEIPTLLIQKVEETQRNIDYLIQQEEYDLAETDTKKNLEMLNQRIHSLMDTFHCANRYTVPAMPAPRCGATSDTPGC